MFAMSYVRHFSEVSPTSIRSRILKVLRLLTLIFCANCFTHVDPFEDTERSTEILIADDGSTFHPRRSVRGY